jgi:hypothetical protein
MDLVEEEGADTEVEVASVVEVASTTTCMAASMDTCHSPQKISLWLQALQKDLRSMLLRVPRPCVKGCPTVASTVGADIKEEGTTIPRLPPNLNLFLHNHLNHKENAANHLLRTTASVADRLHIPDQVRAAASVSTVSSHKIAKHELADAKGAVATKENTTTSLPKPTRKRTRLDQTLATKTHLKDHAAAEETEKSTVQHAKTAETAIIAAVAVDLATTRITALPTTTHPRVPRAAATETAREKRNVQTVTEAIVTANAHVETVHHPPMEQPTITPLPAAHAAKTQLPTPTTKVSRSRARAQAPNPSPHPLAPATLATKTETTDDPV